MQQQIHSKMSSEQLTIQDKENINSIFEMIDKKQTKQFIESLYVKNGKNLEITLDQFLTNNIPKDEYKVVRIDTDFIDTSSHTTPAVSKKDNSELLKQYMLGQFEGSASRRNKNKSYYEQHLRALEHQKTQEDAEATDLKRKMLHLASMMQYEDDFDDQNLYANRNRH